MATSSSTSSKGAKVSRAPTNRAVQAQATSEAAVAAPPSRATASPSPLAPQNTTKRASVQPAGPDSANRMASQARATATPSKTAHNRFVKPSHYVPVQPTVAAPQLHPRAPSAPAVPTDRTKKSPTAREADAGRPEPGEKKTAGPKKDVEKEVSPKKRPAPKEHPYTQGRMSTATAFRHVSVHLAAGLVGGHLINKIFDRKTKRKAETPSTTSEASRQPGARRAVDTQANLSPRQLQHARISRASAQAGATPVTPLAANRPNPARRAADGQTQPVSRPQQQARIKRAPLQAAPVKTKGRGR